MNLVAHIQGPFAFVELSETSGIASMLFVLFRSHAYSRVWRVGTAYGMFVLCFNTVYYHYVFESCIGIAC